MRNRPYFRSLFLLGLAALLVSTSSLEAKKPTLERKFRRGVKAKYELTLKIAVSMQQQMGMGITADLDVVQDVSIKILSVEKKGPAKIETSFGHSRGKFAIPMFTTMDFDSRAKEGSMGGGGQLAQLGEAFTALDGTKMTFTMDRKGKVSNVTVKQQGTTTNPAAAAGLIQVFFAILPSSETQAGSTWDDPSLLAIAGLGDVMERAKLTHTLEKFDSKGILIKTKGSYRQEKGEMDTPPGQGGGQNFGGAAGGMGYLLNTKMDVTALRDDKISGRDGLPLSQNFDIQAELESPKMKDSGSSSGGGGFGGGGDWTGSLKLAATLERVKRRRR